MKKLVCMLAVCVFAVPGAAVADTVTETFTLPAITGYIGGLGGSGGVSGSDFTLFNPALGTLTSATFVLNATSTWSDGGMQDKNAAFYSIEIGSPSDFVFALGTSTIGNGSETGTVSSFFFTEPGGGGLLRFLIGPGTAPTSVSVVNVFNTPASIVSTFAPESVTYAYIPAAVPEPAMLPVLAGILAVGLFWRRRKAA